MKLEPTGGVVFEQLREYFDADDPWSLEETASYLYGLVKGMVLVSEGHDLSAVLEEVENLLMQLKQINRGVAH